MKTLKTIWLFFQAQLQQTAAYRGMIFIWMFESFFFPVSVLLVWISIAHTTPAILNQLQDIINYYTLLPLISILTSSWHGIFLAEEIRYGKFNQRLVKPIFPLTDSISNNLAEKFTKIFFIIPFIILSHLIFSIQIHPSPIMFLSLPLTIILASIISFLIETAIGFLAFWMDEISSLENLADIADYTFGGKLAPIFLFPPFLQSIAILLPFRYMTSFPLEMLAGTLSTQDTIIGFSIQSAWIFCLAILNLFLWKTGIQRYSAIGG